MNEAAQLGMGVIGAGQIGALRARALRSTPGLELVAVADQLPDRAATLARNHGVPAEADWRRLLERPEVRAVVISTPPASHTEIGVAALEAGKHVLCEKPLARDVEECERLLAAAEKAERVLATGFNFRFFPAFLEAKQALEEGWIGALDHVRGYTGYRADDAGNPWMHDAEMVGGGALRDNGIHLIDLVGDFLGDVASVTGWKRQGVWNRDGCEDNGFLLLTNQAGNVGSLQASWSEWRGYRLLLEVYGDKGCIRASCFPMWTQLIWREDRDGRWKRKRRLFAHWNLMEKLRGYDWLVGESFRRELAEFARAITGEPSRIATGQDGALAVAAAAAATTSTDGST